VGAASDCQSFQRLVLSSRLLWGVWLLAVQNGMSSQTVDNITGLTDTGPGHLAVSDVLQDYESRHGLYRWSMLR
jgi:hypothetical protein